MKRRHITEKKRDSYARSRKNFARREDHHRRFDADAIGLAAAFGGEVKWPPVDYARIYSEALKEALRQEDRDPTELAHNAVQRLLSRLVKAPDWVIAKCADEAYLSAAARNAVRHELHERAKWLRWQREFAQSFAFDLWDNPCEDDDSERFIAPAPISAVVMDHDALKTLTAYDRRLLVGYLKWVAVVGRVTVFANFGEEENAKISLRAYLLNVAGIPMGSCSRHSKNILRAIREGLYTI